MNVFSADDFAPNPRLRSLSYYRCRPRPSPHQAVNVSSIDKPTNCYSYTTSSSMSSQTLIGTDSPQIHNPRPCYSHNSRHRLNIADSLKTMN